LADQLRLVYEPLAGFALLHQRLGKYLLLQVVVRHQWETDALDQAVKVFNPAGLIFVDPAKEALEYGLLGLDDNVIHGEELFHLLDGQLEKLLGFADVLEALQHVVVGPGLQLAAGEHVTQGSDGIVATCTKDL
jgi:hypothetical protein